jgi:hypothetical protein
MKYIAIALIYMTFFALILGAVYLTESAWPLFGLLLTPTVHEGA